MNNGLKPSLKLAFAVVSLTIAQLASADTINTTEPFLIRSGDDSTIIVAPADISSVQVLENAKINMTGGTAGSINLHDTGTATISGGNIAWLTLNESSRATISGGNIDWLRIYDTSSVRITEVDRLDWIVFGNSASHLEVVGSNIHYSNGQLSGYWSNGKAFSFWAITEFVPPSDTMPSNILISSVPEPSMAFLMLGGILLVAARRKARFV